jgi:hypothetical protein
VIVLFGKKQRPIQGMLIIPAGNDYPDRSSIATPWLWSEGYPGMPVGTQVTIIVGDPCDPMLTQQEDMALKHITGLTLKGVVEKNWNTSQADLSKAQ